MNRRRQVRSNERQHDPTQHPARCRAAARVGPFGMPGVFSTTAFTNIVFRITPTKE
jgi:hypothetical protein